MSYSKLVLIIVFCITTSGYSQDGITVVQNGYYPAAQSTSYPFLGGRKLAVASEFMHSPTAIAEPGCCMPLIPTLAQGIRDTINALLPCRGVRRGAHSGLLFSERFYESSCCGGSVEVHSGSIIESDQTPTPAQPSEEPELVVPESIDSAIRFQPLPTGPRATTKNEIRPVSGRTLISRAATSPSTQSVLQIPYNPLRP